MKTLKITFAFFFATTLVSCGGGASKSNLSDPGNGGSLTVVSPPPIALPAPPLSGATFANGKGVYVTPYENSFSTSSDGKNWSGPIADVSWKFSKVVFANDQFLAIGAKGMSATSIDGLNWTLRPTGTDRDLVSIAFADGRYVAVGVPSINQGGNTVILASLDGIGWTVREAPAPLRRVEFLNGRFTSIYGETLYTSLDGLTWSASKLPVASEMPYNASSATIDSIVFGNGRYVITVLYRSVLGTSVGIALFTSEAGRPWQRTYFATASNYQSRINALRFAAGTFIAVGSDGLIQTSKDGLVWVARDGGPSHWYAVSHLGNTWFVAGDLGALATSTDGVTWTKRQTNSPRAIFAFRHSATETFALQGGETGSSGFYSPGYLPNAQRGTANLISADGLSWAPGPPQAGEQFNAGHMENGFY